MLFSSLLISCAQCKSIWSQDLPVLYHVTLEQGKPLQVQHCYTKLQLMDLNGTLDAQFLSQLAPVTHLRLYLTRITKIEAGAVCTFPTLRRFELSFKEDAKVPILRRNIFENCEQLEELSLVGSYGNPSKLEPNTFLDLVNLKNLSLMYLDLHHLKKEYFGGLKSLTHLDIAQCNVQQIDEDTFYELDSLKQLTVFFNSKFSHLPMNLFKNARNLEKLFLVANNLTGLTWDEFEGLSSLRELQIGRNKITSFDADKIAKNMPNLSVFYSETGSTKFNGKYFASQLESKLNHSVAVSFRFELKFYTELEDP
jgi:Leucine-rich repeat (LRR) protein